MRTLANVFHVPKFDMNMISLGIFDSDGYKVASQDGNMKLLNGHS